MLTETKLVQGAGAGSLVSWKSAEAEEMWLKRIAEAEADCCGGEGKEAYVKGRALQSSEGTAQSPNNFRGWWGNWRAVLSKALCASESKGYLFLEPMEKSVYLLLQLLHILEGVSSKLQGLELFASAPDGWRTRPTLSCRNKVGCCGGATRKTHA